MEFPSGYQPQQYGLHRTLTIVEQMRNEIGVRTDLGESVPTDVFVFGLGEPRRMDVTKIGGVPYRPADKPWPVTSNGIPYTFIGQFSFRDSHDIVGPTPAEMLLLFAKDSIMANDDPESLLWEWQPLGTERLISAAAMPAPEWNFITCYGVRHRSVDYIDAAESLAQFVKKRFYLLQSLEGTKIGGLPGWIFRPTENIRGKLLCTLGSVQHAPARPYPFVNHPAALPIEDQRRPELTLLWGDMGMIHIFMDEDEQLSWSVQW